MTVEMLTVGTRSSDLPTVPWHKRSNNQPGDSYIHTLTPAGWQRVTILFLFLSRVNNNQIHLKLYHFSISRLITHIDGHIEPTSGVALCELFSCKRAYSTRSATIGSVFAARRAGMRQAASATATSSDATPT